MPDIFSTLDGAHVEELPFPHLILEQALDPDLCDTLVREMPPLDVLTEGSTPGDNKRFSFSSAKALSHPEVSETWKSVIEEALSQPFLNRFLRLFRPYILAEYPDFEERFGDLNSLTANRRVKGTPPGRSTIDMDAQIAVNTPVIGPPTSVRCPHLDIPEKLLVGLLYLRRDGDESQGGNLEIYSPAQESLRFQSDRSLPWEGVRLEKMVPYRRNTLVMLLNTPRSLHGVSPRTTTESARYFINLVGEVGQPLFDVDWQAAEDHDDDWFTATDSAAPPIVKTSSSIRGIWDRVKQRLSS